MKNIKNKLLTFLGLFNLTDFEKEVLSIIEKELSPSLQSIFKNQINRCNRVERFLKKSETFPYGWTNFYYVKGTKSITNQIEKLPYSDSEQLLGKLVFTELDEHEILVECYMVTGILFELRFFSKKNRYYPIHSYVLQKAEVYL